MMRLLMTLAVLVLIVQGTSMTSAFAAAYSPDLRLLREAPQLEVIGQDVGKGNVIGVSTFFEASDFESAAHYAQKIDLFVKTLQEQQTDAGQSWLRPGQTVVVFPEDVGLWLTALGEGDLTRTKPIMGLPTSLSAVLKYGFKYQKASLSMATLKGVLSNLNRDSAMQKFTDWFYANVLVAKADQMAAAYDQAFSTAAAKYHVTIIAGSIPLPDAFVVTDTLGKTHLRSRAGGKIYGTLVAYDDQGRIIQLTKKVHVPREEGFAQDAPLANLKPIATSTAVGSVGALICADSWFKDAFASMAGARLVVVPEYSESAGSMSGAWAGYSLATDNHRLTATEARQFAGIEDSAKYTRDASGSFATGALSEHEALIEYTAPFWAPQFNIRYSMIVPNRTQFLDLGSDNGLIVTAPGLAQPLQRVAPVEARTTFVNVYLAD